MVKWVPEAYLVLLDQQVSEEGEVFAVQRDRLDLVENLVLREVEACPEMMDLRDQKGRRVIEEKQDQLVSKGNMGMLEDQVLLAYKVFAEHLVDVGEWDDEVPLVLEENLVLMESLVKRGLKDCKDALGQ